MSDTEIDIFLACAPRDQLAWLEAGWLADQGLEIWCEDGVNPGTPDWQDCVDAIDQARHRVFLITAGFAQSRQCLACLEHAVAQQHECLALILDTSQLSSELRSLTDQCTQLEKRTQSFGDYKNRLSELLGVELSGVPDAAISTQQDGYTLGEWQVYPQLLRIVCGQESKTLDRKLFDVLTVLVERAPQVVTLDEFLERVWRGTYVNDNSVHRAISRLRKAFRDDPRNPTYIETIAKNGYRLIGTVGNRKAEQVEARSSVRSGVYVQLKRFEGIGGERAGEIAQALTSEVQEGLARNKQFNLMPRADQVAELQRRPKYVVAGLLQLSGEEMRVSLELDDLSTDTVVWTFSQEFSAPERLADQTSISNALVAEITKALV